MSVVVPMYKARVRIEATRETVVHQTQPADRIEMIAVDDASPDDSAAVARAFFAKHWPDGGVGQRTRTGGVPVARSAAWRTASGDWIQFLDQDDLLALHKIALQAVVATGTAADVAVVYSNWQHLLLEDGKWQPSGPINAPFVDDEPHWRQQGGSLSQRQRQALAARYSRFADLYLEHNPQTYSLLKGWLKELGFAQPVGLTPRLRTLSRSIGYENAVRVRLRLRKVGGLLRGRQ